MVSISECFSESYAEARPKFCSAAAAAGGEIRSWLNPKGRGPNGEALYLDTARFGPTDAEKMLVLIAGTHGVEGHCGSGAEIAWLRNGGAATLPARPELTMPPSARSWAQRWFSPCIGARPKAQGKWRPLPRPVRWQHLPGS